MNWLQRYKRRYYFRGSIWILPAIGSVAALFAVAIMVRVDRTLGLEAKMSVDTGRIILTTVAASLFTLVALACSGMLIAVQLASGQMTPRIIALVYQNWLGKVALAVFIFTFTYSVALLARIEDGVPLLSTYVATYGFLVNLALFLFFIDGLGKMLRPSAAMKGIARVGREVIQSVYPYLLDQKPVEPEHVSALDNEPVRVIRSKVDGAVLAFDMRGLTALAERSDCVIEMVPEVGDYISIDDELFKIFDGGADLADQDLHNSVAVGPERTMEQDPKFAFRILVDIASKALSPAINDPTTAVIAVDHIHHLLRYVGSRYLATGNDKGKDGRVRLVYKTPNWEDFVYLSVTEIRQYGRDSIQIMRRLRTMMEDLIEALPDIREPLLQLEVQLLERSIKRNFPDIEDRNLAALSDPQGLGGGVD